MSRAFFGSPSNASIRSKSFIQVSDVAFGDIKKLFNAIDYIPGQFKFTQT